MKKLILLLNLFCASASFSHAQKPIAPAPQTVKKISPVVPAAPVSATFAKPIALISDAEWKPLVDALTAENWDASATLAERFLARLKIDNEKKQVARLRYFYLHALAGKILKLAAATKNASTQEQQNLLWEEIKRASARFLNREFVLPPRLFSFDCKRAAFNYVCTVKGDEKAVRTVATNAAGSEIHSFDYVLFDEKIASKDFSGG
ncbi:MAG: hypothetical protein H0U87_07460, partial [Acidobacteria bacterium]|nr:hypothetical protein [Acidobacteriota bacterium]